MPSGTEAATDGSCDVKNEDLTPAPFDLNADIEAYAAAHAEAFAEYCVWGQIFSLRVKSPARCVPRSC